MTLGLALGLLLETWLPWAVVVAFLVGGFWVLAARPRALLNRAMGAFLLLYAGSTAAYQRWIETVPPSPSRAMAKFQHLEAMIWFELAFPFLTGLVLIGLFAPERRSRGQKLAIAALLAGMLALFSLYLIAPRELFHQAPEPGARFLLDQARGPLAMPLGILWLSAQAAVVLLAGVAARSTDRPALQRRQAALVGLAYAFPLGNQVLDTGMVLVTGLLLGYPTGFGGPGPANLYTGLALLVLPGVAWAWVQYPRPFRGRARSIVGALVLLTVLLSIGQLVGSTRLLPGVRFSGIRSLWLGALAVTHVVAAVKYDVAGSGHVQRRGTQKAVLGLSTAAVLGIPLGVALASSGLGPYGMAALGAGTVLTAALAGPWLAAGAAARVDGSPRLSSRGPGLSPAVASYRAALADLQEADGGLPPGHGPALAALRAELGLTDRDHAVLLASLECPNGLVGAPPVLLGRYLVEAELGRGGSATVYRAKDPVHGRTVVLKRYHLGGSAQRSYVQELETLSRFRDPRVIALYDAEEVGEDLLLVLEHVEGRSLEDRLREEGPLDPAQAARLTGRVLEALAAVHRADYVHGDLKPGNVLLTHDGRVKLGDFGTARLATGDPEVTRTVDGGSGTLSAMSPEQVLGGRATKACDTYAAGALLYRLVTGEHYLDFENGNELVFRDRILHHPPRLPHPRVPEVLEGLLARALAKAPGDRFATAEGMAAALSQLEELEPGASDGRPTTGPTGGSQRAPG